MTIEWSKIAPVIVSIGVIIAVAVLRQYSKTFAAIAATMPINVPLGLWIVYAGTETNRQETLREFSEMLLINIFPTVSFLIAAYLMTRAGHGLISTIVVGYLTWGICLAFVLGIRAATVG